MLCNVVKVTARKRADIMDATMFMQWLGNIKLAALYYTISSD